MLTMAGVGSVISGLGSIFGGKSKSYSPRENILGQAEGARQAAEMFGFNPLTMLQYGQPGGSLSAGGAPPLASLEYLGQMFKELDPEYQADLDRQRQKDQLDLDLARLRIEQARSGIVLPPATAAQSVGQGPSPLGRTAVTVFPSGTGVPSANNPVDRGSLVRDQASADPAGDPVPLTIDGQLADGTVVTVPNPNTVPDSEQWAGYLLAESKRFYNELPARRENLKQRVRNYGQRVLSDVYGQDEKQRRDAKRSAYGPQQKYWPF